MTLLGPLVLFLGLGAGQAHAFMCFGMDMITATMCIAQKTSAIAIMTKLEHDPRAGTWASEGRPGVGFADREEKAMSLATSCLDLISCTAANAMAWSVAGSIPHPVKGDLGNFPSELWYGAALPTPGQSLDQVFDDKDPDTPTYARSTPFFNQAGSPGADSSQDGPGRALTTGSDTLAATSAEQGGTVPLSASTPQTPTRQTAALAGTPPSQAGGAAQGDSQAPIPIRGSGDSSALDLSQAAGYAPYGGWGSKADPDEIVGFMPSAGASTANLSENDGLHAGRTDGYARGSGSSTVGMTSGGDSSSSSQAGALLDAPNP